MSENPTDPLQLVLAQLGILKAGNDALQESLAKQEARHHEELTTLRKDFEERLDALARSASTLQPNTTNAESGTSPAATPLIPTPPTTQTRTDTNFRSERLPDPPAFSGKKKDLPLFLTKLRFKLDGNSDRFPNEKSRLIYAHSRLERDPATLIDPLIGKDICTVERLIEFLEATYGDPNRELTAWSRLDNLRQGKKSFFSHFAEFRRLVADTNLNEGAQINQLRRSLSDQIRRAMVGVPIPRCLNDYANLISLYDNDLRYLPTVRTTTSTKQAQYPVEMEIDVADYAPKGSAERKKRLAEGRCFKCNKKGHISNECSVALPKQQVRAYSAPLSEGNRSVRSESSRSTRSSRSRGRRSRNRSRKGKASSRG